MRAWTFQLKKDLEKLGPKASPWYCGWIDPSTRKRRSKRMPNKTEAVRYARELEGQAAAGTYNTATHAKVTWQQFRERYDVEVLAAKRSGDRVMAVRALKSFERICQPCRMNGINSTMIARFIARRQNEPADGSNGKPVNSNMVTPATVNRDLRYIRAALKRAHEWKLLSEVPKIKMMKELDRLPRFITEDDFMAIYAAAETAKRPFEPGQEFTSGDWWRALLVFLWMTGWRIAETQALDWDQVSLDRGEATTLAETNKSGRDEVSPLHPIVIEHLRKIIAFDGPVFPWPHSEKTLWHEFIRIQAAAGVKAVCEKNHEHTPRCYRFGFHDFRRSFATRNAKLIPASDLMKLMRHRSFSTTLRYINAAHGLEKSVAKLNTPSLPMPQEAGIEPQL